MMQSLGSLEEFTLLLVLVMDNEVYGVTVGEEYFQQTGKSISIPAIHTVLKRLEKKGLIQSKVGGATQIRGGRRKRIYEITDTGYNTIRDIQDSRNKLWKLAPTLSFPKQ